MTISVHPPATRVARQAPRIMSRALLATAFGASMMLAGVSSAVAEEAANGWSYSAEAISSGVNGGFQLTLDPVAGKVYVTDAQWRAETRDASGNIIPTSTASGKLVVFNSADRSLDGFHSFVDLTRVDGQGTERQPLDWTDVGADQENNSSMRVTFSPYGVAVDGATVNAAGQRDATIITTTARGRDSEFGFGGHVVIYNASQGAPTDADRLWQFADGSPIFEGMRRVAVNSRTHKAYITNMGQSRGEGELRPGYIAVIDLPTRTVDARVPLPNNSSAIGVAVDEDNDLVYVGAMNNEKLFVFSGADVTVGEPQDFSVNADAMRELDAEVGANARPEYDSASKRVYVAAYGSPQGRITAVDGDPASPTYGQVVASTETGPVNAVTIDGQRGLLYSANIGDKEVVVYDSATLEERLRVPTSGEPINAAIDPQTRDVWVANRGAAGKVDVIRVLAPQ